MAKLIVPVHAVIDTNVLRAGIRSRRRPECACLEFISRGLVIPLCTPSLFLEYEEVLSRPETLRATGLSLRDISDFLTGLAAVVEAVEIDFDWRPLLVDPDDDAVANCAINGRADVVVSGNVRHLRPIEEQFGISVLDAKGFVARMRAEQHDLE